MGLSRRSQRSLGSPGLDQHEILPSELPFRVPGSSLCCSLSQRLDFSHLSCCPLEPCTRPHRLPRDVRRLGSAPTGTTFSLEDWGPRGFTHHERGRGMGRISYCARVRIKCGIIKKTL